MDRDLYIGIDVGGTNMRGALVDSRGSVLHLTGALTEIALGAEHTQKRLIALCRNLVEEASRRRLGCVQAIGLGVAGKIDRGSGTVIFSPNLLPMRDFPLGPNLHRALNMPVIMENDANAFGLGESWTGAGRDVLNWVGLTLGTGVGGCIFLKGKLWRGDKLGFVGEIGHTILQPGGELCACGRKGCLESYAGARALVTRYSNTVMERDWARGGEQSATPGAEDIHRLALSGDRTAAAVFEEMGRYLGIAISNVFTVLGIRRAIIGGGVSASWGLLVAPLMKSLVESACMLSSDQVKVERAVLGEKAAVIGAARAAWLEFSGGL